MFSAGGHCEQFWHGQGCAVSDVHPAFSVPTTASPTLQGALTDGFGEAVVSDGWAKRVSPEGSANMLEGEVTPNNKQKIPSVQPQ